MPTRVDGSAGEPGHDCPLCPRLVAFRHEQRTAHPDWFNAPVPSFGDPDARLLIVGLAPGLQGANRTGRPFTGDYAGQLLYATLRRFGFAQGDYDERPDDGLVLTSALITNAVRCVPPENKPIPHEIKTCRTFLEKQIAALPRLAAIVALGRIAHDSVLSALAHRRAAFPFTHGAQHAMQRVVLFDSYHCSRYNTNTGVLTPAMFESVFAAVRAYLDSSQPSNAAASPAGSGTG